MGVVNTEFWKREGIVGGRYRMLGLTRRKFHHRAVARLYFHPAAMTPYEHIFV